MVKNECNPSAPKVGVMHLTEVEGHAGVFQDQQNLDWLDHNLLLASKVMQGSFRVDQRSNCYEIP